LKYVRDRKMYRAHTEFEKKFAFRFLTQDELERFVSTVETRFNIRAFGFTLKSVRPEKFKREDHSFSVSKIYEAIAKHPTDVRVYDIRFSNRDIKGKALIDVVSLGIRVTCRSKFGDNDENERMIELEGLNCGGKDFDYFVKAANQVLRLERYLPPGTDVYDVRLSQFLDSDFLTEEIKALIAGPIQTRQYELAVKALAGLVESSLREKLLALGDQSVQTKAGTELAKSALNKESGVLVPPWNIGSESIQGAHLMFHGFFMWIRNTFHHHARIFERDKNGVLELIQLCSAMLKILEKCKPR
jgi:hypothetical protein